MTTAAHDRIAMDRTATVVAALLDAVRGVTTGHKITYDEYTAAKQYAIDLGESGEWPLFADVCFEAAVEKVEAATNDASAGAVKGHYFIPGVQMLEKPYVMPMRAEEPGDTLVLSGVVTTSEGSLLAGAEIDMWQSDNSGTYSGIRYPPNRELPTSGNLRARFTADATGVSRCAPSCLCPTRFRKPVRRAPCLRPRAGTHTAWPICTSSWAHRGASR